MYPKTLKNSRNEDIMKWITTTLILFFTFSLSAQGGANVEEDVYAYQKSESVLKSEEGFDAKIKELNDKLRRHTVLLRQKIIALPAKTILTKGKENSNGDCEEAKDQTASDNTCIKLEVFDFQDSEWGLSDLGLGSRAKYMTIFYQSGSKGTGDPMREPPGDIKKIVFSSTARDFKSNVVNHITIEDAQPAGDNKGVTNFDGGPHDEQVTIYYKNGFPTIWIDPKGEIESISQKGVGKYKLKVVENTKTHPIRNTMKKGFIIKNLDYFNKLFANIADTNERYALKKYKESGDYMKSILKY